MPSHMSAVRGGATRLFWGQCLTHLVKGDWQHSLPLFVWPRDALFAESAATPEHSFLTFFLSHSRSCGLPYTIMLDNTGLSPVPAFPIGHGALFAYSQLYLFCFMQFQYMAKHGLPDDSCMAYR